MQHSVVMDETGMYDESAEYEPIIEAVRQQYLSRRDLEATLKSVII